MSGNPFDLILARLDRLEVAVCTKIEAVTQQPRLEWEPMPLARRLRRRGTDTLMKAVEAGKIRVRRDVSCRGGRQAILLNRDDLDRIFPAVSS